MKIVDNFLAQSELSVLQEIIMNEQDISFPFFHQKTVAEISEDTPNWSWQATHMLYCDNQPSSTYYELIKKFLVEKIEEKEGGLIGLLRVKVNFYPWTSEVKTHSFHTDFDTPNKAAIFSLNTCDGYTMFEDGTKVESIANRMLFFDPQVKHCSSTTSNYHGRYNINFNYK